MVCNPWTSYNLFFTKPYENEVVSQGHLQTVHSLKVWMISGLPRPGNASSDNGRRHTFNLFIRQLVRETAIPHRSDCFHDTSGWQAICTTLIMSSHKNILGKPRFRSRFAFQKDPAQIFPAHAKATFQPTLLPGRGVFLSHFILLLFPVTYLTFTTVTKSPPSLFSYLDGHVSQLVPCPLGMDSNNGVFSQISTRISGCRAGDST